RSSEHLASLIDAPLAREALPEPEGARQEGPFFTLQPVASTVALEQPAGVEPLADRIGRSDHPLVLPFDEANRGQAEKSPVQSRTVEGLHEDPSAVVVPFRFHGAADVVPGLPPPADRRTPLALLGQLQAAIERDPAHHLRIDEVPRGPSD